MSVASVTLGEGNTPLLRSRAIGAEIGLPHLYFKLETVNPTGSYKDRFAAAAINDMLLRGKRRVIASSSGNAGAALAAYCAAAGMSCQIAVVIDAPDSKLKQMQAYGAELWKIQDFGLDAQVTEQMMNYLKQLGSAPDASLQITTYKHCPTGMAGVESISHELMAQMQAENRPLNHVFVCAGGGGLTLAVARGLQKSAEQQAIPHRPRVHCVQPTGNNTIAGPLREGLPEARSCVSTTKITGLQVASVLDGNEVIPACRDSGGTGHLVEDASIYHWQTQLARREGIFCEPAGAAALAGAVQAVQSGLLSPEETVVCLVTGSGFKDAASIDRMLQSVSCPVLSLAEFQAQTSSH